MNRRGFLTAMLAAGAAPAICKADNLMKIFVPPEKKVMTLASLAADFDGDVRIGLMGDKLSRNAVYGKHAPWPRGESPYFVHIDEAPFFPGDRVDADRDYFKAWTESNGNLEQTHRRLTTPRRDRRMISIRTNKSAEEAGRLIEAEIRRIKPVPGPLVLPRDDQFKNVNLRPWNERIMDLLGVGKRA